MRFQAGSFDRQFTWLIRSYTLDADSGAEIPSWTGSDTLWGSLVETTGKYGEQWGSTRNRTNATITLLQFPEVDPGDRLQDILFDHVYIVDSISLDWEANQTVLTCYRLAEDDV